MRNGMQWKDIVYVYFCIDADMSATHSIDVVFIFIHQTKVTTYVINLGLFAVFFPCRFILPLLWLIVSDK